MKIDNRMHLYVKVEGKEDFNAICSALRGLLHANGQSDGQTTKNGRFRTGTVIEFGGGPSLEMFLDSVRKVLRRRVRDRIRFERR
ncbi:hypothetical protein [Brevundimonas sp.]|uniref:hypothetical protein n=1 Tax=Brevundimonas sp. TaxID=1871086 RepID=UPI0028AEA2B9|nr:hypothetical protein [Brevundimonas sp.]